MRHEQLKTLVSPLVTPVCRLAREAGAAIMQMYANGDPAAAYVDTKADDSPLTLADLAAHRCLAAGLGRLTPALPVVSEEDAASLAHRQPQGTFWLIDPLDGTKEFLARNGEFTVNIALVCDGEAVWGVVYAPALDCLYWGGAAFGAERRDTRGTTALRVAAPVAPGGSARVVASKSHLNAATRAFIDRLGPATLVQAGSSLKFCRIAEGNADVYPRLAPTCEWDTAAAQAVLEGAGGHVCDTAGRPLRYGKADRLNPDFIATATPPAPLDAPR